MKKIVVFGGNGGLGTKLLPLLREKYEVFSPKSSEIDITNLAEISSFLKEIQADIILNMSGKKYDNFLSNITTDNYQEINSMVEVNIKGSINIFAACLPSMIEKKYGRVIMLSSIFAELNIPKNSIYCASKAFIDRLVSTANKENIQHGITCNTIQLGYWDGGMCHRIEQKYQDMAKSKIGLKRCGSAEELYSTINYLVDTEYICGTKIKIDGGI